MTANRFPSYELFVKVITFSVFYNRSGTLLINKTLSHFQASKYCLERIFCFDFRDHGPGCGDSVRHVRQRVFETAGPFGLHLRRANPENDD